MASTHKHLRSSTANKRPTTSIADGQIAINTNSTSAGLFFKDSTGATIIKVGPVHVGTTAPNSSPGAGGSAGNSTGEVWLDTSLTPNGIKIWNASGWVNATPISSTTVQGLLELATDAETQAGTDNARAVTPASLQSKVSDSVSTVSSSGIASSTAVKTAYDLANAALPAAGGTITGALTIGSGGSFLFEGATNDTFETTLGVIDPTADRSILLPDISGTLITTNDIGTVSSGMILDGTIGNAEINASAAIVDTKLATINTADKVSLSALNIDGATDIGAELADADLFIVDDGGAGTNRKAAATRISTYVFGKVSGDVTVTASGVATVINGTTSTAGKLQLTDSTSSTSTTTAATPNSVKTAYDLANAALPKAGGIITGDIDNSATGYFDLPAGTTAQRPGTPNSGMTRFNTTTAQFEGYNGTSWNSFSTGGGDVVAANNNAFTGANTFTNSTGQIFRQAATQDGILLRGRAGGTTSLSVEIVPTTLTASRTLTAPNVSGTIITTGDTGTVTNTMLAGSIAYSKLNLALSIDNDDIATAAAIAGSKISPNFSAQNVQTSGNYITTAGNVNVGNTGVLDVGSGTADGVSLRTASSSGCLHASNNGNTVAYFRRRTSDGAVIQFNRDTTSVGTISVTTTATAYNTSSDYRLKENVVPVNDGISRLQQLKPSRFNFIAEPDQTVDGFIAHEVQSIVPEAITGQKDATDSEGNPIYQGIDQSKLVPLLTAALQEAVAKIEALEARLAAAGI